jgi:hypothetical protein
VAIEIALVLIVAVVAIAACGRPIIQAYSKKMEAQFKELEPQQVREFTGRLSDLEEQVRQLKKQTENAQETADFAMKLLHEHELNAESGQKLKLSAENKEKLRGAADR